MLHDRNKEKLNCDFLTLMSVGGGCGHKIATMLLFFVIPYIFFIPQLAICGLIVFFCFVMSH